ncbi:DUF4872 domain-containing protein [Lysinibacillus sp. NPDC093712]|uniref:BtrH N-terminal domain-containing protein n=1 Tax=Lysinibacillus sp. NPDC093712 TaxID=3390579 RepID=UPI003D053B0A
MKIVDFPHRLSVTCRAGNIRDLMEYEGYKFTETMLFGLSNGLSFAYLLPEETKETVDFAMISGVTHNQFEELASSLRMHYASCIPTDSALVWEHIKELLQEGKPVFLDVVLSLYLKYLDKPALPGSSETSFTASNDFVSTWDRMFSQLQTPAGTHVTMLIGIDELENQAFIVENNLSRIQTVPLDVLKYACNPPMTVTNHPQNRYGVYYLPTKFPNIKEATKNAIYANMHSFLYTSRKYNGINAIERLAEQMPNWLELMPRDQVSITMGMMFYISEKASGGGFYRRLFAGFLREAAHLLGEDSLEEISKDYYKLSNMWRELNKQLAKGADFPESILNSADLKVSINNIAAEERRIAECLLSLAETWRMGNESFISMD